jgi:hypothetical protein
LVNQRDRSRLPETPARITSILRARAAIADQMNEIEGDRVAALRDGEEPRPLTANEWERLQQLDAEWCRLGDALDDLGDAQLARPIRSRHGIANKLQIIADSFDLPFDPKAMIE